LSRTKHVSLRDIADLQRQRSAPAGGKCKAPAGDGWRRPLTFGVCDVPKGHVRRNCFRLEYVFDVYSEAERREELNYTYNNPVKRGLESSPGDWPWSSWRFYFLHDASVLRMDRLD
jgi:hypothetical protein